MIHNSYIFTHDFYSYSLVTQHVTSVVRISLWMEAQRFSLCNHVNYKYLSIS